MQKNIIDEAFAETLKILSELIKFQTVSGTSNVKLIEYCEKKLSKLGATSFKTFDKAKQRVNLFSTISGYDREDAFIFFFFFFVFELIIEFFVSLCPLCCCQRKACTMGLFQS